MNRMNGSRNDRDPMSHVETIRQENGLDNKQAPGKEHRSTSRMLSKGGPSLSLAVDLLILIITDFLKLVSIALPKGNPFSSRADPEDDTSYDPNISAPTLSLSYD
jgi:hypothetical protein